MLFLITRTAISIINIFTVKVRHPLRVITTLVLKCTVFDQIWFWISNIDGFEFITPDLTPLVSVHIMNVYFIYIYQSIIGVNLFSFS
jgi:hypothetical protein